MSPPPATPAGPPHPAAARPPPPPAAPPPPRAARGAGGRSMTLRIGTSGIPRSSARPGTDHGIRRARELGLQCLEMAWVNGIKMGDEAADGIARAAREDDLDST